MLCACDVLGSGERVSLLDFALAAPPLSSAETVEHTHSLTVGWSLTKSAQSDPFRRKACYKPDSQSPGQQGWYGCRPGGSAKGKSSTM